LRKASSQRQRRAGLSSRFGNHQAMISLVRQIGFREGSATFSPTELRAAAAKIGKGSERYAMHVKGLELPGYDVRGAKAHGLSYATAFTGADHNRGYAFQEIFGIPFSILLIASPSRARAR